MRHAREAGATKQEIAEAIAVAGLFGGVPAMTKAMELATEAMTEDRQRMTAAAFAFYASPS